MVIINGNTDNSLEWTVFKGLSGDKEDFTRSEVSLFVISKSNKIPIAIENKNGSCIKALIPAGLEIPTGLTEQVYNTELIWIKNGRDVNRTYQYNVFKVSRTCRLPELTVKTLSTSQVYGYDGLSAYEMSVLNGKTNMSEEEWLVWQNGIPQEVETLINLRFLLQFGNDLNKGISQKVLTEEHEARINAENELLALINSIINDKASIELSITPNVIFADLQNDISLIATTDTEADSIVIKNANTEIASGSGLSLNYLDKITPSAPGNIVYSAEFSIAGLPKVITKNVPVVHPILYGAGGDYTDARTYTNAKTNPSGVYSITTHHSGDYIFFVVPRNMNIMNAKMGGFDFPLNAPVDVLLHGVEYKYYQSANAYNIGTLTIVIS